MNAKTVLISGAGIAGPTLAWWLRAGGFAPTLVEHAPALRRGGYVVDFWGLGYDIAETMGLREELEGKGYHAREVRFVDEAGKRVAGFSVGVLRELSGGRFVTIARSELSRMIFEKVRATCEVMFDNEIAAQLETADGVEVAFRKGPPRRFDLVVGADGLHSRVRKLAFGEQDKFEHQLGYVVAAFEAGGIRPREEGVFVACNAPGRQIGRFALRDDRTLFLTIFAADRTHDFAGLDVEGQRMVLRRQLYGKGSERARIVAALENAGEFYFDRVSQIRMKNWTQGRIALIGDAAFCPSLLAGQGAALAMTSAYVLAGELARADGDYRAAFPQYEARLRSFVAKKQDAGRRLAGAFVPRTRPGLWFRNQVIKTFAIPGMARLTIGSDIVDRLKLPQYALACAHK